MDRCSKTRGFTLLELMVVVAIIATLLMLGLPSFQTTLRSNRLATTTNQFNAAVALARSEAIKSTQASGLCPSADGTSFTTTWSSGWLIWRDTDRNGSLNGSEPVIQYFANTSQIAVSSGAAAKFSFDDRGAAIPRSSAGTALGSAATVTFQAVPCPVGKPLVNALTINLTGQVRTVKGNCS